MFINSVSQISFGSATQTNPYINRELYEVVCSIINAVNFAHDSIKTYPSVKKSDFIQKHNIEKLNTKEDSEIIFLSDNKKYKLSIPNKDILQLDIVNTSKNNQTESFIIKDRKVAKVTSDEVNLNKLKFLTSKQDILSTEKILTEAFDELDFRLLKLKRDFIAYNSNKEIEKTNPNKPLFWRDRGILSDKVMNTVKEINDELDSIYEASKLFASSATCTKIRQAYSEKLHTTNGTRKLVLSDLGEKQYEVSVNPIKQNNKQYLTLKIKYKDGKTKNFVIRENGQMQIKPDIAYVSDYYFLIKDNNHYLSQQEIDKSDIFQYLLDIKKELKPYNLYLRRCAKKINAKKDARTTTEIGSTEKYNKEISNLRENFFQLRDNIKHTFYVAGEKNLFKARYNISIDRGQHSIIFKKITNDGNDLYLDIPKIQGKEAIKIMEFNGNEIFNTFVLQDNKLIKFSPKKISAARFNTYGKLNYHTQETIDNSSLSELLKLMNKTMNRANKEINEIRQNKAKNKMP